MPVLAAGMKAELNFRFGMTKRKGPFFNEVNFFHLKKKATFFLL